jgi:hypothetical protein
MNVAYLITAYNNYEHLKKLLEALSDQTNPAFYVHIDKKSEMPSNLAHIKNLKYIDRKKVWWGGWSHLNAILLLMKAAFIGKYDYYVLISGADYPIRSNEFLYNKLQDGGEYFNIIEGFQPHKPESRLKYYHFDCFDRRNVRSLKTRFFLKFEHKLRLFLSKSDFPFEKIYHGSTWWALSHGTITYILDFMKDNPSFVNFFKSSWCPEESFIPTIIGNSPIAKDCKNNLTYTDWSVDPGPADINIDHIKLFENKFEFEGVYGKFSPFFARKFNDGSAEIITEIDRRLR